MKVYRDSLLKMEESWWSLLLVGGVVPRDGHPTLNDGKDVTRWAERADRYKWTLIIIPISRAFSPQEKPFITWWWQLKYLLCSPRTLGKIPNLTNIFQMGSNHQLDKDINRNYTPNL